MGLISLTQLSVTLPSFDNLAYTKYILEYRNTLNIIKVTSHQSARFLG